MTRRLMSLVALTVALATGCSSAVSQVASTPAAVQGIGSDKVVHMGAFMAQSGPLANAANVGFGVKTYFNKVNSAGGVNGYKFDYTMIDDGYDPTKTVTVVKQLWEQDKVFGLLIPYGTGTNAAAKQYVIDNKIPTYFPYGDAAVYFSGSQPPPQRIRIPGRLSAGSSRSGGLCRQAEGG